MSEVQALTGPGAAEEFIRLLASEEHASVRLKPAFLRDLGGAFILAQFEDAPHPVALTLQQAHLLAGSLANAAVSLGFEGPRMRVPADLINALEETIVEARRTMCS